MIKFEIEKFDDVIDEIMPMLQSHYIEIATDKDVKAFIPDLDKYRAMESAGMLRIFTARETVDATAEPTCPGCGVEPGENHLDHCKMYAKNGKLIGYFVSFVMMHMHYSQVKYAINDIMYVAPSHRGRTTGYKLIKLASEDLKKLGADILIIHMKVDYPFRSLLTKLGFHLTEENWERVL